MEFNNKRLERTSKIVHYLIAFVLSGFLIGLSQSLIDDMSNLEDYPVIEDFQDSSLINQANAKIAVVNLEIKPLQAKREQLSKTIEFAEINYQNAKESYENWLKARQTVGSPTEDQAILSRVNELDAFYATKEEWIKKRATLDEQIEALEEKKEVYYTELREENARAHKKQFKAIKAYDLRVFLIRLAFILPILGLAIFFLIRFRKHKYWSLFLGYILFAFYAFFFGLVPYLPSYGGYVRYAVGIILSVVFGVYAINRIKKFIDQKKKELKASTTERAKQVKVETAEKALDKCMCPSCGKGFMLQKWENSKKQAKDTYGLVTNFCRYCGLELFKPCQTCGTENYAHLPFCSNCGNRMGERA